MNSLLLLQEFPVNLDAQHTKPRQTLGFAPKSTLSHTQKNAISLLNSLLIHQNRENPPSPLTALSKTDKTPTVEIRESTSHAHAICNPLLTREYSAAIRQRVNSHEVMAETMGFEPTRRFPAYSLSRGAPSTTRPRLHLRVYLCHDPRTRGIRQKKTPKGQIFTRQFKACV